MIMWEVKNRVECNSYCNSVLNRRIVVVNGPCFFYLTDKEISFCNVYGVGCFYIDVGLFGCVLD